MDQQAPAPSGNKRKRLTKKQKARSGAKALGADVAKFQRGESVPTKRIADQKTRGEMGRSEWMAQEAAVRAAKSEILQPHEAGFLEAEGMEKTFKFTQDLIRENVDKASARKIFELKLEYGQYKLRYSRNGRHLLMGGQKGHVALLDWHSGKLQTEFYVNESCRDVSFLHNETLYAVAQKKYVFIYDTKGVEIHKLKHHVEPMRLEFLPYHLLLCSVGNAGFLKYQDVSTGDLVAEHRTGKGKCDCLRQNHTNAIMHLGHGNGTVSLWSPSVNKPLVSMLAHRGPVRAIALDQGGNYMATTGMDGYVKCWDVRTFRMVHAYTTVRPADGLDISQNGLLAVGQGSHVQVWKDALQSKQRSPYMSHEMPARQVSECRFCPFEDVLGVGHSDGFASLAVPGAAFANFDSFEANPYQTQKQQREAEVKGLLEKLRPEMITLDANFIGTVADHDRKVEQGRASQVARKKAQADSSDEEEGVQEAEAEKKKKEKRKKRGRSTAQKRFHKKQTNVEDNAKQRAVRHLPAYLPALTHASSRRFATLCLLLKLALGVCRTSRSEKRKKRGRGRKSTSASWLRKERLEGWLRTSRWSRARSIDSHSRRSIAAPCRAAMRCAALCGRCIVERH
jgi:U3 small nucleolar RNA-associated protein 7